MNFSIIETTLILVLTALIVSVVFRIIRLPIILGYLVVGVLVGPHVLGWLPEAADIKELAEFGVALLMFTIGLEFSFSKIIALRHQVFILGGLQVLISILITTLIGLSLQMTLVESIVVGSVVAMSSTAIVIKQLSDQFELHSKHGLNAVGILLFQDLAVIPILVLIASLSGTQLTAFPTTILWALSKGILAILIIMGLGRWLLKPLFHIIASTRIIELFTLSVLFVAIASAWFTNSLGISYALGAFLAGIMLGETEFRHQINVEIRPFKDVLLGLFFISVGMLVNIATLLDAWMWIVLLLAALIIGKTILIILLCHFSQIDLACATRTGVVLSQGGEFGFAILTLSLDKGLISLDYGQVILTTLLVTFALAPIIIRYNKKIAAFFFPNVVKQSNKEIQENIKAIAPSLSQHIIICGYGRVGQNIARFLKKMKYPYLSLDLDPEIIRNSQLAGENVAYGNATHLDILKAAQLDKAKALVICFNDLHAAINIIEQIRRQNATIPILVRCKDESDYEELKQSGATKVVTEVFEESLSLASYLLELIHVPEKKIMKLMQEIRDKNYALLYQVFPGTFSEEVTEEGSLHEYLRPVPIPAQAHAVNKALSQLALKNVEVVAIRRGKKHLKPNDDIIIHAGDILILFGLPTQLDGAEEILLI
ncbi:cation:proton antiporter [Legionella sp. W05-934-2]|uniref:cation:proton antiporter domain-containing protein n=1 Tax=Legionella sp. W05-934-2 TaxID=1198649 RepID=UPI0034617C43